MQQTWKVIAAFVGVFIAGAVFGAFFTRGVARWVAVETKAEPVAEKAPVPTRPGGAGGGGGAQRPALLQVPQTWQAPQLMRRYAERLALTPEQKERVHPLLQRAAEDYRRVQQNTFRETGIILKRLQQDIAKELTPEQRTKLEAWETEQSERLRKFDQRAREPRKNLLGPKAKPGVEKTPAESASPSEPEGAATPSK